MTDKTTPEVTDDDRREAYKWAKSVESNLDTWGDRLRAPARVILDAVPAPPPPRPTLADMTPDERDECTGMQADLAQGDRVVILDGHPGLDGRVLVLESSLDTLRPTPKEVTPRPDLHRLELPGEQKPAPALPGGWRLAHHPEHGRVLVVRTDGENAIYATPYKATGIRTHICMTSDLEFADTTTGPDHLAVGSEWDDVDALTQACEESGRDQIIVLDHDGDAYVWSEAAEWWESVSPMSVNDPFTIIHTGKKTDQ